RALPRGQNRVRAARSFEVLFRHRDRPDHIWVKPAVILNRAGRLEHDMPFAFGTTITSHAPFRAVAVWATISSFTHSIVSPTWAEKAPIHVRFGSKADIDPLTSHVGFTPKADIHCSKRFRRCALLDVR